MKDIGDIAWDLATRLGRLANQLDAWADKCRSSGCSVHQIQPIRDLACGIRSELHGFTPSKEALEELSAIRQRSLTELQRIATKYRTIHGKRMAELKQDLTNSPQKGTQ